MIRVPVIRSNQGWTNQTVASAAVIPSLINFDPQKGYIQFTITPGSIVNNDTLEIEDAATLSSPTIYTFKTTLTGADREILIDSSATRQNIVDAINRFDSTIFDAYLDVGGSTIYVQSKLAGAGNDIVADNSPVYFSTYTQVLGHDGARLADNKGFTIELSGVPTVVASTTYTISQTATDIATYIDGILGAAASVAVVGTRVVITNTNGSDADDTVKITAVSGSQPYLFELGRLVVPNTLNHPQSDKAASDNAIRMFHPSDPLFFRNDNRPLIDLADNDKKIYNEFIALRDGYNYDTGSEFASGSNELTFKAKNGYTFNSPVTLNSTLILKDPNVIQMNTLVLNVADKTITLNAGETGQGVEISSIGTSAGFYMDRGQWPDTFLLWDEGANKNTDSNKVHTTPIASGGGHWVFDGPVIGTAKNQRAFIVGRKNGNNSVGTLVEFEQVTIGDGVNTFGTFNAAPDGNITTAFLQAKELIDELPTPTYNLGGRIFIKRGHYYITSMALSTSQDYYTIEGEGASTLIQMRSYFQIQGSHCHIKNIRFIQYNASASYAVIGFRGSHNSMLTNCWITTDRDLASVPVQVCAVLYDTTPTENTIISNCIFDEIGSTATGYDIFENQAGTLATAAPYHSWNGNVSRTQISNL